MMDFKPVSLNDIDLVERYTFPYGEGSCQHSPVAMWSLSEKYGDEICVENDILYILRSNLCDDDYRVYLAPLGEGDMACAYGKILSDAHSYGKKVKFLTLTAKHAQIVNEAFPGQFDLDNNRDLHEYIFSVQTMLEFPGKVHARRRTEIRSFWRDFGERASVGLITQNDLEEVLDFAYRWLKENAETHDEEALEREMTCIRKQIANYDTLHLSGTVIRVDGKIGAFCYGVPLNDEYYDVLIEKGDRSFPGIYRVLRQESTKLNVSGYKHINFEEDVGVTGLRRLKESYCPEFMIEKYVVTEL